MPGGRGTEETGAGRTDARRVRGKVAMSLGAVLVILTFAACRSGPEVGTGAGTAERQGSVESASSGAGGGSASVAAGPLPTAFCDEVRSFVDYVRTTFESNADPDRFEVSQAEVVEAAKRYRKLSEHAPPELAGPMRQAEPAVLGRATDETESGRAVIEAARSANAAILSGCQVELFRGMSTMAPPTTGKRTKFSAVGSAVQ